MIDERLKSDERMIWCPECDKASKFTYSTFMLLERKPMNGYICEEELKNGHADYK